MLTPSTLCEMKQAPNIGKDSLIGRYVWKARQEQEMQIRDSYVCSHHKITRRLELGMSNQLHDDCRACCNLQRLMLVEDKHTQKLLPLAIVACRYGTPANGAPVEKEKE